MRGNPTSNIRGATESPAIFKKTSYKMLVGDITIEGKHTITSTGYAHIFAATRTALAVQHLAILKTVIARGIPRVYVDNGHILSRMNSSASKLTQPLQPQLLPQQQVQESQA